HIFMRYLSKRTNKGRLEVAIQLHKDSVEPTIKLTPPRRGTCGGYSERGCSCIQKCSREAQVRMLLSTVGKKSSIVATRGVFGAPGNLPRINYKISEGRRRTAVSIVVRARYNARDVHKRPADVQRTRKDVPGVAQEDATPR